MPKIGTYVEQVDLPCLRCGSKRRVSKTWTEKLENSSGFMLIKHSQIVCTNKVCQAAFEKAHAVEEEKREKIKLAKMQRKPSN